MKRRDVDVESPLKYSIKHTHISIVNFAYLCYESDMNIFEHKNLLNSQMKSQKRKSLFRTLIKPVEAGAHGTLNYVVKKGLGKNKIAKK